MTDYHHVSGQVTQSMLEAAETMDWPYTVNLSAAGVTDEDALRSTATWVSWEDYLGLIRGLTGGVNSQEAYLECGILAMAHSAEGSFKHLGILVGGAKPLYQATFGWIMSSLLRRVRMDLSEVAPGRLRIEVYVDEELGPSEPFFYTLLGTMTALPRSLGRPDAMVEADIHDNHAVYHVVLPTHGSVWARLSRSWKVLRDQDGYDTAFVRLRESITDILSDLRSVNVRLVDSQTRWQRLAEGIPGVVLVVGSVGEPRGPFGATVPPANVLEEIVAAFREEIVFQAVMHHGDLATFEVVGGDSQTTWSWSCRASKLPDEDLAVIVALDESERLQAQIALRDREQRLLQAQKMQALGRLAGGVAHDFNNLLAAIQGHADLLELKWGSDPHITTHLDGIVSAVTDASALTRQLLAYGRSTPPNISTVDAAEAVRSHEAMYTRLVGDAVTLSTQFAPGDHHVCTDPSQLQQVVMNLVVNARDAMPDGGEIVIRTQLAVQDGTEWVDLEVCDEGQGMADDVLARAMEPFFTTKELGRGSGLGLSTVYWIVEQAGGHIQIDSTPGLGTCVHVLLPRVEPSVVTPAVEPSMGRPTGHESILLVEDDDRVRTMVAAMLESQGYRVVSCTHAADARRILDQISEVPSLLLTDITMPGESGVSLANDLAKQFEHLGIVLMSGYTAEPPELDEPHRSRGHFLAKPFGLKRLTQVLRTALDESARS